MHLLDLYCIRYIGYYISWVCLQISSFMKRSTNPNFMRRSSKGAGDITKVGVTRGGPPAHPSPRTPLSRCPIPAPIDAPRYQLKNVPKYTNLKKK